MMLRTGVGFLTLCWMDLPVMVFDLSVRVLGDLQVDDHHTIEDTGGVLEQH